MICPTKAPWTGRGWRGALARLLSDADAKLLARHKEEILSLKALDDEDRNLIDCGSTC